MTKPTVCIVGRPNVGKSTLFNRLIGSRISIEEDFPGVTRDRIYADASWLGKHFTLIDTGGLDPSNEDVLISEIRNQTKLAIELSDLVLFMVNGKEGITITDEEIAELLRLSRKPVLLVVNKIDSFTEERDIYEFYQLGFTPLPISSINNLNLGDLLDEIVKHFPDKTEAFEDESVVSVAIVGKPNVGKSSLLNRLLGENRVIVSPLAGTTREAIDADLKIHDKTYRFIDTAGIRRKKKIEDESIERYSVLRSFAAIDRSEVTILVIDASEGFTEQDKKIVGYAHEAGKGILVLVNKWDLVEKGNKTYKEWTDRFYKEFPFLSYAMIEMVSVLENHRIHRVIELIDKIHENRSRRISTGQLNDLLNEAILMHPLPQDKGKSLKIYYATQSDVAPPQFVFFVNTEDLMHFSYLRYLENRIREAFDFKGTPIQFILKEKKKDRE
ncbi:ribosome biogenesis GTPase Der [Guggenheimella bovis]